MPSFSLSDSNLNLFVMEEVVSNMFPAMFKFVNLREMTSSETNLPNWEPYLWLNIVNINSQSGYKHISFPQLVEPKQQ